MRTVRRHYTLVALCVAALLTVSIVAGARAAGRSDAEAQVEALQAQLVQAFLKADGAFFEKYFADDATFIHSDGKLYSKADDFELKGLTAGTIKYDAIDVRDSKVRAYGVAAVVTSHVTGNGTFNGKPHTFDGRITRVWVRRKGEWKMVAYQYTKVAPTQ